MHFCYFLCAALLDEDPTDIIYKDHVKDHLDSMGLGENTKYHLERQTIMCSATIPQRCFTFSVFLFVMLVCLFCRDGAYCIIFSHDLFSYSSKQLSFPYCVITDNTLPRAVSKTAGRQQYQNLLTYQKTSWYLRRSYIRIFPAVQNCACLASQLC